MVFFVCEGCNETLKKNKVDAHAARCRNCWAVSCVDCSVVFQGNDYAAHTSCISEAQKYEGALYKAKRTKLSPQERWVEAVASARAPPSDAKLQNVLDRVAAYDNVPRKKAKFVNFMKNSVGAADPATVEKVWGVFEDAYKKSETEDATANSNGNGNGYGNGNASAPAVTGATANGDSSDNKRKEADAGAEREGKSAKKAKKSDDEAAAAPSKPVKWAKLIKSALTAAPSKEIELSTLRDQVLQQVKDAKLSSLDEKALKKEFKSAVRESGGKFTVVEVVRLTE